MIIRILSEKKIKPIRLVVPNQNKQFFGIRQAPSINENIALPISENADFQVFMHHRAYQSMWEHVSLDLKNELGGALIGFYAQDPNTKQKFILITDVLNQPPEYYADPTLLRFTTQFYDGLATYIELLSENYPNIMRLGLYHSHPGYGVFLSGTDMDTFKGIFKDPWQVAFVTDPIQKEDGVFFWMNKEVSPCAAYQLYKTSNTRFDIHPVKAENEVLATYNHQLILASGGTQYPKYENPDNQFILENFLQARSEKRHLQIEEEQVARTAPQQIQMPNSSATKQKISWRDRLSIGAHDFLRKKRKHIDLGNLECTSKNCYLYDVRYNNKKVKLGRYFRPFDSTVGRIDYPAMIFLAKDVIDDLEKILEQQSSVTALLQGRLHYDQDKKQHFVDLYQLLYQPIQSDLLPFNHLPKLWQYHQSQKAIDLFAWIHIEARALHTTFPFYEKHRQIFQKKHNLGIIGQIKDKKLLDLNNLQLIAYDFEKQQAFNHFKHLFIYRKLH